ncbi:hypothetical protein [Rudaeicoccus suwonensis]|uniref:Uncharacterized protein n=1 Tax=Rudaeicoccus suwonensis TaxID=657409 RepID=A0A561E8V4_9MICO|nr:hypothetical protein [Rudaeicoccus suwonensis]TWE12043.1 hypothetical protein BKA23_0839 [Rudaeicoccus suwonensis]
MHRSAPAAFVAAVLSAAMLCGCSAATHHAATVSTAHSSRPSKSQVIGGASRAIERLAGTSASSKQRITWLTTCVADRTYTHLSTNTLTLLAASNLAQISSPDQKVLSEAVTACQNQLA